MNLTAVSKFLKKYTMPTFTGLVIISLLIFITYRFYSKQKQQEIGTLDKPAFQVLPPQTTVFNTDNIIFEPAPSSRLPLYDYLPENLLDNQEEYKNKFGFTSAPIQMDDINLGKAVVYSDNDAHLVIYQYLFTYQKNLYTKPPQVNSLNEEALREQAIKYIKENFNPNIGEIPKTTYQKFSGEDLVQTTKDSAVMVTFTFTYKLSGAEVLSPSKTLSVSYDASGNILKLIYYPFITHENEEEYPLISQATSLELLKNEGVLVDVEGGSEYTASEKSLGVVNITGAYIAYHLSQDIKSQIQPVWVFEGKTQLAGSEIKATYMVPAIPKEYFKAP